MFWPPPRYVCTGSEFKSDVRAVRAAGFDAGRFGQFVSRAVALASDLVIDGGLVMSMCKNFRHLELLEKGGCACAASVGGASWRVRIAWFSSGSCDPTGSTFLDWSQFRGASNWFEGWVLEKKKPTRMLKMGAKHIRSW